MKRFQSTASLGPALVLAALIVSLAPATAASGSESVMVGRQSQGSPPFVFGRVGGNIRPFTVTIASNGQISASGPVSTSARSRVSAAAIKGLIKLARAEGFFALPDQIEGNHVLPDVASLFITVNAGGQTKTVRLHGVHNAPFEQLYAVLTAVAGPS